MTAILAVGSGAGLGIVVIGNTIVIILCLRAAVEFGAILKKHDDDLDNRKKRNGDGKDIKPASEPSKLDCLLHEPRRLTLQLVGGLRLFLGKLKLNLRHRNPLRSISDATRALALHLPDKVSNFFSSGVIHKSKARTMPNDQELSHAERRLS